MNITKFTFIVTLSIFSVHILIAQSDYIVIEGDTILGTVTQRETTRSNKLTFTNQKGEKYIYSPDQVTAFSYRSVPYKSVNSPVFNSSKYAQRNQDKLFGKKYFAKELVTGYADLLLIQEYGVQDRFLININDTTIYLPVSNVTYLDGNSKKLTGGSNARYFAIIKSLFFKCEAVLEQLYDTEYKRDDLIDLIYQYNQKCTDEPSSINSLQKKSNINGWFGFAGYGMSNLNFDEPQIIPVDLYELGQVEFDNQSVFSIGLGRVFMRSNESVTSFEGYVSYSSASFKSENVTEIDLSVLETGIRFRLHPVNISNFYPVLSVGTSAAFYSNFKESYIEIENTTVGGTYDNRPVLAPDQLNSPGFNFDIGFGLMYLTPTNKEVKCQFLYQGTMTAIFADITTEHSMMGVQISYKL